MMALQFTLNSSCPQLPLGSQPENQQSLFVEHTSIGWSHGAATAIEKTSLSRLMKSSYPLPGGWGGKSRTVDTPGLCRLFADRAVPREAACACRSSSP